MIVKYIIIKTTQLDAINFDEVAGTKDLVRYSVDDLEFIVKWAEEEEGQVPESISNIPDSDKSSIMTHAQAVEKMETPEWSDPNPPE